MSFLLSVALTICSEHAADAARQVEVLRIDFVHFTLGHVCVTTNKDYFKVEAIEHHFECVSKAPDWQIYSYNKNNRLFNVCALTVFKTFLAQLNDGWSLTFPADTDIKKRKYCDLPAIERDVLIKGRKLGWTDSYVGEKKVTEQVVIYEGDMVSKTCAQVVNEMLDMHSQEGMYLSLKFVDKEGKTDVRFDCKKSLRTTVPKTFFDVPTGLKKGTIAQVFGNAPVNVPGVKTLIEDMGLGKSF